MRRHAVGTDVGGCFMARLLALVPGKAAAAGGAVGGPAVVLAGAAREVPVIVR